MSVRQHRHRSVYNPRSGFRGGGEKTLATQNPSLKATKLHKQDYSIFAYFKDI